MTDIFWNIFLLCALLGLVVGAGFAGGYTARYQASEIERRVKPPWKAYDRAKRVENIGFLSGVAGGVFILLTAVFLWWTGNIHITY